MFYCNALGNTIPEPRTEDDFPGWAIGVLVAAVVVTVLWVILLIALVSSRIIIVI